MNKAIAVAAVGMAILVSAGFLNQSIANTIDEVDIADDLTAAEFAKSYKVLAVRDAISRCRSGNFKEAVPVLEQYAKAKDVGATYVLAKLYLDGLGVKKSRDRAIDLLLNNVEGGHPPSMVQLGLLNETDSPAQAVQFYKMASAEGEIVAHVKLGLIMENGTLGTSPNPTLAFKYFEKALKTNSPAGMFHVARCHDQGIGTPANPLEATRLFRRAALAGIPAANTLMARRYFEGSGVESDPVAAVGWLLRGSQAGSTEAMVLLGQRYENGDAIGKDLNRAGQLYSAAAKLNDPTGRFLLARMYYSGNGTKADPVRAFVLLEGAQSYPKAKELFDKLSKELSPDQIAAANQKIADAKAKKTKK